MDGYIKVGVKDGMLSVSPLKAQFTAEDFAPVARGEGCAISFLLDCVSPWEYNRAPEQAHNDHHWATLRIAFCYAPQLKAAVDKLIEEGQFVPQLQLTYLMDLWKVYSITVTQPVGKDSEESYQTLQSRTPEIEQKLYAKAVESFMKSLVVLGTM